MSEITGQTKRWFVLLVQDGSEITTQNPGVECFFSEKEAIKFARESAKEDTDGGEGAIYHVMKTTHLVQAKRRVSVSVVATR